MDDLRENEQITELLETLEQNGMEINEGDLPKE